MQNKIAKTTSAIKTAIFSVVISLFFFVMTVKLSEALLLTLIYFKIEYNFPNNKIEYVFLPPAIIGLFSFFYYLKFPHKFNCTWIIIMSLLTVFVVINDLYYKFVLANFQYLFLESPLQAPNWTAITMELGTIRDFSDEPMIPKDPCDPY